MVIAHKTHNYSMDATYGKWEVKVSPTTQYGWFENNLTGAGGGLWFDKGELVDYDGLIHLPKDVKTGLLAAGFVVGPEF